MNKMIESKTSLANAPKFIDSTQAPQNQGNQASITSASLTKFSGPIPPPSFLEQYEKLVPGSAQRLLNEPHLEAEHRRSLERLLVNERIHLSKKGQLMAFFLAALCIVAAFTAIFLGYDVAGLGALFISISPFIGVFVYDKIKNKSQ